MQLKQFFFIKKPHFFLFIYIFFVVIIFLAAYIPLLHNFKQSPSDRFYFGGDEYAIDLIGNITHIRQGFEGKSFAHFMITTEFPVRPFFLKFEYVLIGIFSKFMHIDPYQGIMVIRILLSLVWFTLIYVFIQKTFTHIIEKITTSFLILFATSFAFINVPAFLDGIVVDVLVTNRFTLAMPHYLIGGITGIASIFFISQALLRKHPKRNICISCLLLCISSLTYAPTTVLIVSTFPIYLVLRFFSERAKMIQKKILEELILLTVVTTIVILTLLYVRYVIHISWGEFNLTEKMEFLTLFKVHSFTDYIGAIGITYIFSVLSFPKVIKKNDPFRLLLYPWVLMHPVGLFFLSPVLDLNHTRFFIISYAVPFGILAVDGITVLADIVKKYIPRFRISLIYIFGIALVVSSSYRAYIHAIERNTLCFCNSFLTDISYPKKEVMNAIYWLRDHTNNEETILSQGFAGLLIPAFAGNNIFISRWYQMSGNPQFMISKDTAGWLYSTEMPSELAKDFLQKNNISYVFSSEEERQYTNVFDLPYTFLKEVYRSQNIRIYKVTL